MKEMSYSKYKTFFNAFSNKTKFGIINSLRKNSRTVKEICGETGFEQSRVSHNLKRLQNCGFINCKKKGKNTVCSLDKNVLKIINSAERYMKKCGKKLKDC